MDLRVFEEFACRDFQLERFAAEKVIIGTADLAGACRARGAGNRVGEVLVFLQTGAERGLARPRGGREDEEDAEPRDGAHSMFWICSRIFSISALHVTTYCEISTSLALEPRVLSSRAISCVMNSKVRPTGSFLRRWWAN